MMHLHWRNVVLCTVLAAAAVLVAACWPAPLPGGVIGIASTAVNEQISHDDDDAYDNVGSHFNTGYTYVRIGVGAGGEISDGFRFQTVAVTKAAYIYSATL